jgi:hypothetical protein
MSTATSARPSALRRRFVACALVALALGPAARADDDGEGPTRLRLRNALRGSVMGQDSLAVWSDQLGDGFLGLTYSRQVSRALALEITGGRGNGGNRNGLHAGGGVRFSLTGHGSHALTTALGGHAAFLPGYGTVYFSHVELAWELRTPSGFNLVLGGGLGLTLNSSRRVASSCSNGGWFGCPDDHFKGGDSGVFVRLELGYAF